LIGADGSLVLYVERGNKRGAPDMINCENEVDRSLIKAAPDLLEACKAVLLYDANEPLDSGCCLCRRHDQHLEDCPVKLSEAAIADADPPDPPAEAEKE
jgi:hypothetical protein